MPHELPKTYEPGAIEARWAEYWVREKLFHVETPAGGQECPPHTGDSRPVFTLLLPPPNVTGRLHMGHMLNQTQMDILVRWHRMRGFITLWLPGTDHAGIATQMMVERQLAKEGKKRREMGREEFVKRVWEWKREYGGAILDQMKRLGASVDWGREYFTMDENLSHAVREVFVRLYEEGLIYRGKYIVNWCPRCETAISDLEVKHEDVAGKLWEIRYPVVGADEFITVATTRPETMLGDTAVAVNAADERYTHLHGKKVLLRVTLIGGVHRDRRVAQHRLRARGRYRNKFIGSNDGIPDLPKLPRDVFVLHFEIRNRRLASRTPVHDVLSAINQPLFIQPDEHLAHRMRKVLVHGEVLASPIDRRAQPLHLVEDRAAILALPFPDALHKFFAPHLAPLLAFFRKLALDHH